MTPPLPLEGVRVLDLTVIFAGPAATMLLADWGAEVIRLESFAHYPKFTRGPQKPDPDFMDVMREMRHPYYTYVDGEPGERPWNRYAAFNAHARNKLSVDVDVASREGREQFVQLVRGADVVIENHAPSFLDRYSLVYDDLQAINPRIIVVRMPGFGLAGPYREFKANGLNMDAVTGHLATRGYPDAGYDDQGVVVTADAVASVYGALSTVMALIHRERTGRGQLVEAAMVEGFLSCMPSGVLEYGLTGSGPGPRGNTSPRVAPQGAFPCAGQDRWVSLSVRDDQEWRVVCERLGFTDWRADRRYDRLADRRTDQGLIERRIAEWTSARSVEQVIDVLEGAAAVAPVLDESDVFADAHLAARGIFQPITQADSGTHLYLSSWWMVNGQRAPMRLPPPLMGEHDLDALLASRPLSPVDEETSRGPQT